ncbi:hypothetical protein KIL84_022000 [Mauremys mutica]|uniref:Uncharacterized protein n=1 Tax=Mauremys mutica TaxID=74926 RepID=A0A9D3XGV1_9SAUR|nr:hypothetical protein KIL84_022000 [Mauremys mutica]
MGSETGDQTPKCGLKSQQARSLYDCPDNFLGHLSGLNSDHGPIRGPQCHSGSSGKIFMRHPISTVIPGYSAACPPSSNVGIPAVPGSTDLGSNPRDPYIEL